MSILDLQGLSYEEKNSAPSGSRASKNCGNTGGGGGGGGGNGGNVESSLSLLCVL
jgi:hypothetical protein